MELFKSSSISVLLILCLQVVLPINSCDDQLSNDVENLEEKNKNLKGDHKYLNEDLEQQLQNGREKYLEVDDKMYQAGFQSGFSRAEAILKPAIVSLNKDLELTQQNAAITEFILLYRTKFVFLENNYCTGLPSDDDGYLLAMQKKYNNVTTTMDISGGKHFKKWLWMLVFADESTFTQIENLRTLLEKSFKRYKWFATQIQAIYGVLSDEDHKEANMLDVKFLNKVNLKYCLKQLSKDLREAMQLFVKSEGTFED